MLRNDEVGEVDFVAYKANPTLEERNKIVVQYLPLVRKVATNTKKNLSGEVDVEDLVSYGTFGLMDAIEKFDPTLGVAFKNYAYRRIYGSMIDELRSYDEVPRQIRTYHKKSTALFEEGEFSSNPYTEEEVAEQLGVSLDQHRKYLSLVPTVASLDFAITDEDSPEDIPFADMIVVQEAYNLQEDYKLMAERICEALESLPGKEALVLWLYYYECLTLKDIGVKLDVSESRICQMHTRTIHDLFAKITQ